MSLRAWMICWLVFAFSQAHAQLGQTAKIGHLVVVRTHPSTQIEGEYRVDPMGRIRVRKIGTLRALDQGAAELSELIQAETVRQFARIHKVSVKFRADKWTYFSVGGAVRYPFSSIAAAKLTGRAALNAAQPLSGAVLNNVKILRASGQMVKLEETIGPGDTIWVPNAGDSNSISVIGAVKKPSTVVLEQAATLRLAIAKAGGLTGRGLANEIYIMRGEEKIGPLSLSRDAEFVLRPFDTVSVAATEDPRLITVSGGVAKPQIFDWEPDLTALKVIRACGGVLTEFCDVVIVRLGFPGEKVIRIDFDKLATGEVEDVILEPGQTVFVEPRK